jgi:HSP20 family molecular chaperone IbpA
MTHDSHGPQRPKNDPLETVSSFLTSLGGAFSEVFESVMDNIPGAETEKDFAQGKLPVEVKFLEDGAIAKFDLPPAVKTSDVSITLEGSVLSVEVTRSSVEDSASDFSDRRSNFGRTVSLHSDRQYEPVSAGIVNGVLEVALSSRPLIKSYTIPVTSTVTHI